eukprot:354881-Chlamydomonas_euryale.AAC.2
MRPTPASPALRVHLQTRLLRRRLRSAGHRDALPQHGPQGALKLGVLGLVHGSLQELGAPRALCKSSWRVLCADWPL